MLTSNCKAGLKPVFCDVDSETWNMTIENVKNVATKNTKAVLWFMYGLTADADEIEIFCKDNNIVLSKTLQAMVNFTTQESVELMEKFQH